MFLDMSNAIAFVRVKNTLRYLLTGHSAIKNQCAQQEKDVLKADFKVGKESLHYCHLVVDDLFCPAFDVIEC